MKINTAKSKELRKVFNETDALISDRKYNMILGFTIVWGFLLNAIVIGAFSDVFLRMNPAVLIIGYFILAITGIVINKKSKNPVISFLGYNLLVVPIGAVLSVALAQYQAVSIINAITITGIVAAVMMTLSMIYPNVFLKMGRTLFIALLTTIIVELISILFLGGSSSIIDIIVAIIFCGYIGFDWAMAQQYQKTIDNAIDSALDIYLDLINLFLRILKLIGIVKD